MYRMWLLAFKLKAWFLYNVYEIHMCNRDDKLSVLEVGGLLLRCQNCVRCDHEEANSVDRSSEVS